MVQPYKDQITSNVKKCTDKKLTIQELEKNIEDLKVQRYKLKLELKSLKKKLDNIYKV